MSIMPDEYHSDKKVWLAGLEEGAKREQARIVELLEDYLDLAIQITQGKPQEVWEHSQQLILGLQKRISFIKGETE